MRSVLWDRLWRDISGWKRSVVSFALMLAFGGLAWQGKDLITDEKEAPSIEQPSPELRTSLVDTPAKYREHFEEKLEGNRWSGASTRFGFSFLAAFFVGVVLRIFIRTTVIVATLCGGTLAFAVNQGWIEPFWNEDIGFVETAAVWAKAQTDSVVDFLKGYLPSGFMAGAGFAMGLRK